MYGEASFLTSATDCSDGKMKMKLYDPFDKAQNFTFRLVEGTKNIYTISATRFCPKTYLTSSDSCNKDHSLIDLPQGAKPQ